MRCLLAREGVPTGDGRLIAQGALELPTEPIPLLVALGGQGHSGSRILGAVSEVRREEDSTITGEVSFPIRGMACEIDVDDMDADHGENLLTISYGRLRAVTLGLRPCWDGLVIE